jgi:ABC-2 type transport system ATP-binding protein
VRFDEDSHSVTAETLKPEEFYQRIPKLVMEQGVSVEEMSSPDDNLEAVFDYLVK